jgi:hypothetical protein
MIEQTDLAGSFRLRGTSLTAGVMVMVTKLGARRDADVE